eukprot:1365675-Rhodomonas_salina.2
MIQTHKQSLRLQSVPGYRTRETEVSDSDMHASCAKFILWDSEAIPTRHSRFGCRSLGSWIFGGDHHPQISKFAKLEARTPEWESWGLPGKRTIRNAHN